MKTILITGSAGWIGSCFVDRVADNFRLIAIDPKETRVSNSKHHFFQSYFANLETEIIKLGKIDLIIHLGALINAHESATKTKEYFETNYLDSFKLIEFAEKYCIPFVFISSAAVYKAIPNKIEAINEENPIFPATPYAAFKRSIELEIADRKKSIASLSIRLFNPIGIFRSSTNSVIERPLGDDLLSKLRTKFEEVSHDKNSTTKFFIRGNSFPSKDGTAVRDFIDINDVIDLLESVALTTDLPTEGIVNLGSGIPTTILDVLNIANTRLKQKGKELLIEYTEPGNSDIPGGYADISRAKQLFNWEPKIFLEESISSILDRAESRA